MKPISPRETMEQDRQAPDCWTHEDVSCTAPMDWGWVEDEIISAKGDRGTSYCRIEKQQQAVI